MHVLTSGYLSQLFQQAPTTIEERLAEGGIEPILTVNGIRHFDATAAVDALRDAEHLAEAN